jgi:hypothetical protein
MGLLEEVLDAHGGLERWQEATTLRARVRSGGFAFASHFTGKALREFEATVSTREPHSVLAPYPKPGSRGVFAPDEVRIESDSGETLARRADPRAAFGDLRHNVWWDDLDTLYFAGYAIWNYLNAPFLFAAEGYVCEEIEPRDGCRRLAVRFPDGVPTHSREQVFAYDDDLKLRRHDYTAEPFGGWAKAAHLCRDHERFEGLLLATSRRVYPRGPGGTPLPFPTLVWIEIERVEVS